MRGVAPKAPAKVPAGRGTVKKQAARPAKPAAPAKKAAPARKAAPAPRKRAAPAKKAAPAPARRAAAEPRPQVRAGKSGFEQIDLKDSDTQSLAGGLAVAALAAGLAAFGGGGGGAAPAKKAAPEKAAAPAPAKPAKDGEGEEEKVKFTKEYLKASYRTAPATKVKQQKSTGFPKAAPKPAGKKGDVAPELAAPEVVLPLGLLAFAWISVIFAKKSATPTGTSGFIPGTRPSPTYAGGTVKVAPGYPLGKEPEMGAPALPKPQADPEAEARAADAREWIAAWKKRTGA